MHKKLKLGLARYQLIWLVENLFSSMQKLQTIVSTLPEDSVEACELKDLHYELTKSFTRKLPLNRDHIRIESGFKIVR